MKFITISTTDILVYAGIYLTFGLKVFGISLIILPIFGAMAQAVNAKKES